MAVLYTNNASSTLASGITNVATSLTVATGQGALFPALSGSDVFYVTLTDGSTWEIVKVTSRTGDVFTVVRGQDGTSAAAWNAGALVELRIVKALLDDKQAVDPDLTAIAALAGTSGFLKKTAADTWALDTNTYLTSAVTSVTGTAPIVSSGGATPAISISAATTGAAGSMSAADKTKLDGVATGATANTGTVTTASVVSANGFAGTVATATSTPAITLTTSITGVLKGNGTAMSAATAGTDYAAPGTTTTWTAAQTFDGGLIVTNEVRETPTVANTGTAYTVTITDGTLFDLTLTGNCTFTFPTATAGRQFTLVIKQDATGSRTITWPASVRWAGGTAPTPTSTASRTDVFSFIADGTYWIGFVGGQNYTRA